jgi:hypothetical protein
MRTSAWLTLETPMSRGTSRSMSAQRCVTACFSFVSRLYVCSHSRPRNRARGVWGHEECGGTRSVGARGVWGHEECGGMRSVGARAGSALGGRAPHTRACCPAPRTYAACCTPWCAQMEGPAHSTMVRTNGGTSAQHHGAHEWRNQRAAPWCARMEGPAHRASLHRDPQG